MWLGGFKNDVHPASCLIEAADSRREPNSSTSYTTNPPAAMGSSQSKGDAPPMVFVNEDNAVPVRVKYMLL